MSHFFQLKGKNISFFLKLTPEQLVRERRTFYNQKIKEQYNDSMLIVAHWHDFFIGKDTEELYHFK